MRAASLLGFLLFVASCASAMAQSPLSAAQEQALKAGDVFHECPGCPETVVISAGAFQMGSPASEKDRLDNESPLHRVTIRPFALGKFELTVKQFATFADETRYDTGSVCDVWQ